MDYSLAGSDVNIPLPKSCLFGFHLLLPLSFPAQKNFVSKMSLSPAILVTCYRPFGAPKYLPYKICELKRKKLLYKGRYPLRSTAQSLIMNRYWKCLLTERFSRLNGIKRLSVLLGLNFSYTTNRLVPIIFLLCSCGQDALL